MRCKNIRFENGTPHNCGRCMPCRINKTSEWTLRMMYELQSHINDGASFLTLTYNEENLPVNYTVSPREISLFFKRLRKNLKTQYHEFTPEIKYFACGEYGEAQKIYWSYGATKPHGRPHYHAIVYGLDAYNDTHREIVRKSWTLCEPWFFDKERGRESGMQEVTPDDIRYVAGYTQKKLYGREADFVYGTAIPPFSSMSNGIGLEFAMKNKERLINNGFTFLKDRKIGIPRYFCEKFNIKKADLLPDDIKPIEQVILEDNDDFMKWLKENYGNEVLPPKALSSLHNIYREEKKCKWVQFEKEEQEQISKLRGAKL